MLSCWKEWDVPLIGFLAYLDPQLCHKTQKIVKSWQTPGRLLNFKSNNKVPQSIVSGQGDDLYEPLNFANEFNNYFSEIGSRMAEKIPSPIGMPEHTATLFSSFYLYETTEEEVVCLLGNLSEGKAIDENDIPTKNLS